MGIDFAASAGPTLGVEWEFGLVDKTTRDLVNAAREVFDGFAATHGEDPHLHHELLRNTIAELDITLGLAGVRRVADLDPSVLAPSGTGTSVLAGGR